MSEPLLEMRDVKIHFPVRKGVFIGKEVGRVKAVDGVSLTVHQGEILGLVGESGCGKSTLARGIVQLVPITEGQVLFEGKEITSSASERVESIRRRIQMVFQDPYASLNPRMTVFDTLAEPMIVHGLAKRSELPARVSELMERVGLAPRFMKKYPHEFSGGQRQRIAIARTLALQPKLILADEPVSALDVSVQAQIINLIAKLCREEGLSMMFISHDLSVVRHLVDRIAVMYLGKIVELGETEAIFNDPKHPYTRALLSAIPEPDPDKEFSRERLRIEGELPSPMNPPQGCPFHPRCPHAEQACKETVPPLAPLEDDATRTAACIRLNEIDAEVAG